MPGLTMPLQLLSRSVTGVNAYFPAVASWTGRPLNRVSLTTGGLSSRSPEQRYFGVSATPGGSGQAKRVLTARDLACAR